MKLNFLIPLLLLSAPAYAQWKWQNPWPQGNNLFAVYATDTQHCWMAGDNGTILFADGNTIIPQKTGTDKALNDLFFFDHQEGWAAGENGTLLHFEGDLWTEESSGLSSSINTLQFLSKNLGYAVGADGKVLKYENNTWSVLGQPNNLSKNAVWFDGPQEGWVAGVGNSIQHFNGGSWLTETLPSLVKEVYWIKRLNNGTLWASCKYLTNPGDPDDPIEISTMFQYTNGTWNMVAGSLLASKVISFVNDSLFAYYSGPWNSKYFAFIKGGVLGVRDVAMVNANHAWAVGVNGGISFFDGNTWTDKSKGFYGGWLQSIQMSNPQDGIILLRNSQYYYKLQDSIWRRDEMYNCVSFDFQAIDLYTPDYGWAVGEEGRIWTYENGVIDCGYQITTLNTLNVVKMLSENSGWVVDNMGDLYKVTLPWDIENHSIDPNKSISDIQFDNMEEGWAVGWDAEVHAGFVYRYTNGVWSKIKLIAGFDINAIFKVAPDNLWVAGSNTVESHGMIGHFDGQSWSFWEDTESGSLYDIHFTSPDNCWAVGSNGTILHCDGQNWTKQRKQTSSTLLELHFLDEQNGWIIGNNATVLHITNGGTFTGTNIPESVQPDNLWLSPNPSTEFITLNSSDEQEKDLDLTLLDGFGRIIQRHRNISLGSRLDVSQLNPGIYFWVVTTDGRQIATGKLLMLKD